MTDSQPSTSGTAEEQPDVAPAQAQPPAQPQPQTPAQPQPPRPIVYLPPSSSAAAGPSNSSTASTSTVVPPIPSNEDTKPTTEELQSLYASTVERNYRLGINPNAPLMTKAMREREEAKRGGGANRRTYSEIKIRFRLPDRTTLEYTLPSSTRLLALYPLLRSSFTTSAPVILYTSPPKVEYKADDTKLKDKKLSDMGWGGAAVVQVRFVDGKQASLKEELLKDAKVLEPPKMGMSAEQQQASSSASSSAGRTLGGGPPPSDGKEKKVPKWFKGFKK